MAKSSLRLRAGDIVRIRTERWVVQQQVLTSEVRALDVRGVDATNAGERVRFLLPFEPVELMPATAAPTVVRPAHWRRAAGSAIAGATCSPDSLRVAARARFELMPYQLEPALAVTGGVGCRLLIADAVGLGKTVQAGLIVAELLERNPDGRALVVCPAGLRQQWQRELQRRFGLDATVLDAAGITRAVSTHGTTVNPWAAAPVIITSIDFIKRAEIMRAVEGLVWDALVLDEAHNLATRSDRSAAAAAIAWRARIVVLLSATPHAGDDDAFGRLASLGDIATGFPLLLFKRTRADAGVPGERRTVWMQVRPTAAEARMHTTLVAYAQRVWRERSAGDGARLAMTVLMRRAASSAGALARSLDRRLAALAKGVSTPDDQLPLPFMAAEADEEPDGSLLAAGLADAAEERTLLERLLVLARLASCDESKVAALCRWMSRVQEPVLVFTEYRDTLHLLHQALATRRPNVMIAELHGGLTRSERDLAEGHFTTGRARVLLATDAASEGLNLHHRCRCVINLEIPWTPVRLEQRIGRVDRIGQQKRVHAIQLVAAGTFEPRTVRRLVDRAVAATEALSTNPDDVCFSGPAPSHEATADAVLTGGDVLPPAPVRAPAVFQRVDLSARAHEEARMVGLGRLLSPRPSHATRRPVTTILHRHSHRLVCAFEITLTDTAGVPVWSTIVGADGPVIGPAEGWSPTDIRATVSAATDGLQGEVAEAARRLNARAAAAIRLPATLWKAREHQILAAVRRRHARIASDLLQPGLFDRRAERDAASQAAVLEEALARCHLRLESLARLSSLRNDAAVLRFAIVTR